MNYFLSALKSRFGAEEFHFKDIYNGNGVYHGVSINERLDIFLSFAGVFREFKYPMIISTIGIDDIERNKLFISNPKLKVDNFKLSKSGDFALFLLMFRLKKYLLEQPNLKSNVDIYIDSGRQKPDTVQKTDIFGDLLADRQLVYKSSHDEPLIQLVDFAAFCLNRHRWILTSNLKSALDIEMRQIFSHANFNVLNMIKKITAVDGDLVSEYDSILKDAYDKNNCLTELDLQEFILQFYNS